MGRAVTERTEPGAPREYWSRVAPEKTFNHPLDHDLLARHVPKDASVLDLGCGYGRLTAELHAAGWTRVHGADTAGGMVARAREQHPQLELAHLESDSLPFGTASQDAVLLIAVLTCIPADADLERLFAEVQRVLRPGGHVYVSDLWLQSDERNLARYAEGEARTGTRGVFDLPEGVRLRHFERERVAQLLAPFEPIAFREAEFTTMNGNPAAASSSSGAR